MLLNSAMFNFNITLLLAHFTLLVAEIITCQKFICSLALRTSSVFASQGVPVYLFSKITPTPFVVSIIFDTYAVLYLQVSRGFSVFI